MPKWSFWKVEELGEKNFTTYGTTHAWPMKKQWLKGRQGERPLKHRGKPRGEIDVAELANSTKRKPVAAKYQVSESRKTWSGRGRTPVWLSAAKTTGKSREDFLIK